MLLDSSVAQQEYVEDCEVCCHPIQLHCAFDTRSTLLEFSATSMS
jgi:hypothetical protein